MKKYGLLIAIILVVSTLFAGCAVSDSGIKDGNRGAQGEGTYEGQGQVGQGQGEGQGRTLAVKGSQGQGQEQDGQGREFDSQSEMNFEIEAQEADIDYGALSVLEYENLSMEEMMRFAMEDEYLARTEYEVIIDAFGQVNPFSNIIKAEEEHIAMLKEIYVQYGLEVPLDESASHVIVPESIEQAISAGYNAELHNIAMYEQFLNMDLPDDVRETFLELQESSEKHLTSFERGLSRGNGGGTGSGNFEGIGKNQSEKLAKDC